MRFITSAYLGFLLLGLFAVWATPVPPAKQKSNSDPLIGTGPNDHEMVEIHTPKDPLKIRFATSLPNWLQKYGPAKAKYSKPQFPAEGTGGNQQKINEAAKELVERFLTPAAISKLNGKPGSKLTFQNDFPFQNFAFFRQSGLYIITFNVEGGVCAPKYCAGFVLHKEPPGSQGGDFGGEILDVDTTKPKYSFYSNPDLKPEKWKIGNSS
ncbi:hypothetical protein GYMLUDRAFT_85797 [Collybiopsis luxurians FD-317 M1]|uniref:Unplaced genomic scaffold GYMLUscaffold_31, whole genome shotgun sequence n=1 Tax=Collybiopsis luxurians FD-317 M1 TaxID=944289 RepID=A0A0D0BV56_9AGAR|nr:hypothetical protein GYMLUDRAFT_85797 [Collybiopsis luxurians FD-317 M1]